MPKYKDCHSYITGLGTAVPVHRISQERIGQFMKRHMIAHGPLDRWVDRLVKQSGIEYRHSVLADYARDTEAFSFYPATPDLEPFPPVSRRMEWYKQFAPELGVEAALNCLTNAGRSPGEISHLICVSCTGMYAPGLDVELIAKLGLRNTVARTGIMFMGCYAAFNALKVANSIVREDAEAKVLIVCVELCSLHFQKQGNNNSTLLTNMLFADGASAALVEGERRPGKVSLEVLNFLCGLFPEGSADMTWDISDAGFVMKLSSEVPGVLKNGVGRLVRELLEEEEIALADIRHYAIHPGGPRILAVVEEVLGLSSEDNRWAYEVLREYGNMSSATLFFVLNHLLLRGEYRAGESTLAAAFGPGLTCETALFRIVV